MNNLDLEGKLIVIVAPSGTGKSTMIKRLKKDFPTLFESVSYTTRPMRAGEVDGESYFFISHEQFITMRSENEFLEWAEVHGNLYGTSKSFVEQSLKKGKHLLFDLDVQGTDSFKNIFWEKGQCYFYFSTFSRRTRKKIKKSGNRNNSNY